MKPNSPKLKALFTESVMPGTVIRANLLSGLLLTGCAPKSPNDTAGIDPGGTLELFDGIEFDVLWFWFKNEK